MKQNIEKPHRILYGLWCRTPPFRLRNHLLELPTPPRPKKCGSTPTWGPTGRLADLANACLECLLGLITALVRYAIETKEAKGHGDLHVAYRIFADGLLDRKSCHLSLVLLSSLIFLCVSESCYCMLSTLENPAPQRYPRTAESRCHTMKHHRLESQGQTRRWHPVLAKRSSLARRKPLRRKLQTTFHTPAEAPKMREHSSSSRTCVSSRYAHSFIYYVTSTARTSEMLRHARPHTHRRA
jgi:hypothetical protein